MKPAVTALRTQLAEIQDLRGAASVLAWDQETYMPPGGVETRAHQLGTLERVAHERFTRPEIGDLLEHAADATRDLPYDADDSRLVVVVKRDYDRATRIPASLVSKLAETTARAMPAWNQAKSDSDFRHFAPHLKSIIALCREKAEAIGFEEEVYDALLDEFEPGMLTSTVEAEFAALREQLIPIVRTISERDPTDDAPLHRHYDIDKQWRFGLKVIDDFGFDMECGRQDRSAHPFSIHFSATDVRITTRVFEDFFSPSFFGTLHEAGHGMYEQGVAASLSRTPLENGTSLGVHESQSRLWENQIGRSRSFWRRYYPYAQAEFPEALADVSEEAFYRAVNHVAPSLIRVEADEVTYNLHIMLRFAIERALLSDDLQVLDLPAAWNERMMEYLGIRPDNDADGVLQDIHWSMGSFGYFPTYTIGTLMSAQFFGAAQKAIPDLEQHIAAGSFSPLRTWLSEQIYQHGRKYSADELLQTVTGGPLDSAAWLTYIRSKFGDIYGPLP